ncbi:MAG: tRNA pseudouridine(55) synthase TruB [Candidatus Schekmanbacteria bacterium RBG_16_38_11]|uniref:tRNA pseudouridine synthase B n=1 Tax=Candidatus Schekmanbacteria bacterium RBG_16_38_11 TaxID=1817880 RepID=A0A1F7RUB1_9BACT|nr:MAG: tRNA pseudouridine(55) synthase TruB [Candidatus Schekmanbacteria bacterium RBG_16_38_11]
MNGAFNIYKEKGVSSFYVVKRLRRILGVKKCGHAGTLDPAAEGVIPVCVGKGTKAVSFLQDGEKSYEAVIRFGISTDTQDTDGKIIRQCDTGEIDIKKIKEALERFTGPQEQIPPMFSALRFKGRRLYHFAREGKEVPRKPRRINIYEIKLLDFSFPDLKILVRCSKGTYIRTLASDIGDYFGCGAHLFSLKRVKVGSFSIENSLRIEEVQELVKEGRINEKIYLVEDLLKGRD